MAHVTEKIKCSDFPHLRSELTFQETEEEVKPVEHLSANDEAEFFHEVDKDESRIDFALEVMDGHSGQWGEAFYGNYQQNAPDGIFEVGDLCKVEVAVLDVSHHRCIGPIVFDHQGGKVSQRNGKTDEHPLQQAENLPPKQMNFRKNSKGGGIISNPKIFIADFVPLNRASAWKLYKMVFSGYVFNQLPCWTVVLHASHGK